MVAVMWMRWTTMIETKKHGVNAIVHYWNQDGKKGADDAHAKREFKATHISTAPTKLSQKNNL